jgi:hypothetical protein
MNPTDNFLIGGAILTVAFIVLFLLFRVFVLWYWKLDKIEEHLRAIRDQLSKKD